MTKSNLDPNRSYTFSNYFDMGIIPSELVAEFGYSLSKQMIQLQNMLENLIAYQI